MAVTSDRSQLAAKRSSFPNPEAHTLLKDVMSKEPLTPATTNADPAWADAVRWTVNTLIQAEELGITKANIASKLAEAKANKNQADIRRFLGVEGDFGKQLGLRRVAIQRVRRGARPHARGRRVLDALTFPSRPPLPPGSGRRAAGARSSTARSASPPGRSRAAGGSRSTTGTARPSSRACLPRAARAASA